MPKFELGKVVDLAKLIRKSNNTVIYLHHEIEVKGDEPVLMPLMLGSDDSISVWLNDKRLLHEDAERPAAGGSESGRTRAEAREESNCS